MRFTTWLLTFLTFSFICSAAFAQISADRETYTVKKGDTLQKIAENLGDRNFWEDIYNANSNIIINTSSMSPGIVLELPLSVTTAPAFAYANQTENLADSTKVKSDQDKDEQLKEFKKLFNKVVEEEKRDKNQNDNEQEQVDPQLAFEGFVLDETRSKLGRDFYDLFYQNWHTPEGASNFTITISEQPSIGRGTQVTIQMDYNKVFVARLQPRYEYIEDLSKQAIARCQRVAQQQAEVREQLTGY